MVSLISMKDFKGNYILLIITGLIFFCGIPAVMYAQDEGALVISSPDFQHNGMIPREYTCQGADVNPPLQVSGVPAGARSLVLIVDDPDAPVGTWVHWVVFNISPSVKKIAGDSIPGTQGINDFGKRDYGGPCPPSGTHRYFFKIYALDTRLSLKAGASKKDVEKAMQGHVLQKGQLIGLYRKQ